MSAFQFALVGFLLCLIPTIIAVRLPRVLRTRVFRIGVPIVTLFSLILTLLFTFYSYVAPVYIYAELGNLFLLLYINYRIADCAQDKANTIEIFFAKSKKHIVSAYIFLVILAVSYTGTIGHDIRNTRLLNVVLTPIEKRLPLSVSTTTTLTAISREPGTLIFDYTLKNDSDTQDSTWTLNKEGVLPRICMSYGRSMFDLVDTVQYRYHSDNNQELGTFSVTAKDCISYVITTQ